MTCGTDRIWRTSVLQLLLRLTGMLTLGVPGFFAEMLKRAKVESVRPTIGLVEKKANSQLMTIQIFQGHCLRFGQQDIKLLEWLHEAVASAHEFGPWSFLPDYQGCGCCMAAPVLPVLRIRCNFVESGTDLLSVQIHKLAVFSSNLLSLYPETPAVWTAARLHFNVLTCEISWEKLEMSFFVSEPATEDAPQPHLGCSSFCFARWTENNDVSCWFTSFSANAMQ